MDFEALATECRSAAFRESLIASPVWTQAAETITDYVHQLKTQIQSAESAAGTRNLMQDADAAGEDDDGLSYTFHVNGKHPTAESLQQDFSAPKPVVADIDRTSGHVEAVTAVFRFLRNACAACSANQDACRDAGLIKQAHDVVMHCCLLADVEDETLKGVLQPQVVLQFCVNAVTSNTTSQATAWELFFPDDFQKILVECHQYRKVVAFAVALILNCVNSSGTDGFKIEEVAARRVDLVCARNLVITILHRCMAKPPQSSESDTSSPSELHIDDEDPAFEWICMLFALLFRGSHAKDLYNAVGAHMLSKLWSRVTPEQLIFLRMFTMWAVSTPINIASNHSRRHSHKAATSRGPEEADEVRKKVWFELENEAKVMLLDVLGELTVGINTRLNADGARELLLSLLQELQRVWELGRQSTTTMNTRAAASTIQPQTNGDPFRYRSGLIRVIGNLSFRHTDHQDLVRNEGYLPLFLNHCNIDETNPMIREWSLVALRNLCEGNEANQSYINALRPQGMDAASTTTLDKAKMRADIGKDGNVKLTKKDGQSDDE
ncbi:Spinocerebellar ataxia type 10 protein domain [Phytophthora infestans]|uniref:Spinocerebellar ataxia type 10 protein domain n=1 Tax=Phytophthora infestans TaxID=4787 RepID=A0A833VTA7_PHYIN|nr:Spinocerebellar ataxia type 10 protein domain [Phytophthora infestans]